MARKQSGINEEPSLETPDEFYFEGVDNVDSGEQADFTPDTSYVGASDYIGGLDNTGSNMDGYVGSYVGAEEVVSAANRKKGNFRKTLLVSIVALVLIGALMAFVIWPMLIYPNLANSDFYTPEILQSYCFSTDKQDTILTFTECTADGQVTATWEIIQDGKYGKINLVGQIKEKKNSGDLVIEWISHAVEVLPSGMSWNEAQSASISKEWTVVKTDTLELTSGVNDDYSIKSAADFAKLAGSGATFFLKNDIDLAGKEWTPIADFSGMLMGNGYTIKNLTINASTSNVGFFSMLKGRVQDVKFENANVTVSGRNENVGILCGDLEGTATNVSVSGVVDAAKCTNVGGVFGCAKRSIDPDLALSSLSSAASVTGLAKVGGIAGYVYLEYVDASIEGLTNSGTITADEDAAGGIIGRLHSDTGLSSWPIVQITDCSNTGDVDGRYYVGGIVGYAKSGDYKESVIENAECKANIKGTAYVGCIAGNLISIRVAECKNGGSTLTATGSISENNQRGAYVGGFVGAGGEVTDCTNEVEIRYTGGGSYVGGIIGYVELSINPDIANFKNLVNNATVSGTSYVGGIAGYIRCEYITLQIESAANTANVTGAGDYVGGIIGYGVSSDHDGYLYIYDSNNTGNIGGNNYVGGIMGYGKAVARGSMISGSSSTGTVSGNEKTGTYAGELETIVVQ